MRRLIFVWLLATYPVVFIAAANPGQASLSSVLTAAVAAIVIVTLLLVGARYTLHSWDRGALLVAVLLLATIVYGPLHGWIEEGQLLKIERDEPPDIPLARLHLLLSTAFLVFVGLGAVAIAKLAEPRVARINRGLNAAAAVLLVIGCAQLGISTARAHASAATQKAAVATAASASSHATPDIYYIILDGYARADVLDHYYGFSNAPFLDGLRSRGFAVNTTSFANYNWTFLSLSSALNFKYVHELLSNLDADEIDVSRVYELIDDNAAARFLRQHGYRIVQLQSTWGATRSNPAADVEVPCDGGLFSDEFYRALVDATWLKVLQARASADLARCHLSNFDSLAAMGRMSGPKFVLAHFVLPHHPYLFDRDGRVLRNATISDQFEFQKILWEKKPSYVSQMEFVNRRLLEALDAIRRESAQPPIIVVQSDHGPNLNQGLTQEERLQVRLANFAAYSLPDAPPGLMPLNGSPVNQFPRLFNHYFNAGLPVQPERYFWSEFRKPFEFYDVTGVIEEKPNL